jgi:hypothetical protein
MPDPPPHPVPREDPAFAAALARLELGIEVPAPLQRAAVAALAWVAALDREATSRAEPSAPPRGPTRPR